MPEKCNEPCPDLGRLESRLDEYQAQNSSTHREIFGRLNALERENAVQDTHYNSIMDKLESMDRKHDALTAKLEALEAKPGKRWDSTVDKVIWAVCAAVIAFLLAKIGL